MSVSLVLTVISPDRPGLVEALSQSVANHQGSWLESRMARLDGKFAGIVRVSVPENRVEALSQELRDLKPQGFQVVIARSEGMASGSDARQLRLELLGSDHPGIIREIAAALASRGINVDELRTEVVSAPMSGELLFRAVAELWVPAALDLEALRKDLEALAHELMVDVDLDETS